MNNGTKVRRPVLFMGHVLWIMGSEQNPFVEIIVKRCLF